MSLIIERLGNWNPQLLREIKGRFNPRNITIAGSTSLVSQSFLVAIISAPFQTKFWGLNQYEWLYIFQSLNWILPIILVLAGSYMLISDMAKEESRGRLNFIRLSPQSSQSILIGKILGVPILLYFAIALALPLHLLAATSIGVDFGFVLIVYLMVGAICSFFYSGVLLSRLVGAFQPWLGAILSLLLVYPPLLLLNFFITVVIADKNVQMELNLSLQWYYLPLSSNLAIACLFSLLSIYLGTYGIWQLLNRRFRNPNVTPIGKSQSYLLVTCANLWTLGFSVMEENYYSSEGIRYTFLFSLFFLLPCFFLILIAALLPHRQALQDWARYRKEIKSQGGGKRKVISIFPVAVQDLMFGEKSPALVAVAINIAITTALWMPWILLNSVFGTSPGYSKTQLILTFILNANSILICAAIAQLMLLIKTRKPEIWASGAVAAVLLLHLGTMSILSVSPYNPLWLISVSPAIGLPYDSKMTLFLTVLSQWSVLALLNLQLTRQLRKAGESGSKTLLANRSSLTNTIS